MIGLKRGAVALVDYDPTWPDEFAQEKRRLEEAFGDKVVEIVHVGSTAVPGLTAKPIIDIEVGLSKLEDYKELIPLAENLGYYFMPERVFEDYVFMPKGSESCRTHYLHFAAINSDEWRNVIKFRDVLRANPKLRDEYALLKTKLAATNATNRQVYTAAKATFIERIIGMAA